MTVKTNIFGQELVSDKDLALSIRSLQEKMKPDANIKTQYNQLNNLFGGGLQRGFCSVLFGPAGNAKSLFAMNLVCFFLMDDSLGVNPLYIPLEYNRVTHADRAAAIIKRDWNFATESQKKAIECVYKQDPKEFRSLYDEKISPHIAENPSDGEMTEHGDILIPCVDYSEITEMIKSEADKRDLIIVDPVTAISPNRHETTQVWAQQEDFIKKLGVIARATNTHIMILSHSGKRKKTSKGAESALTMDDMAGAAAFSRFTQYMMILDYHEKRSSLCINSHGLKETHDHTRTMILGKCNFGVGKGQRLAVDFENHLSPKMEIFGVIQGEQ